MHPRIGTPLPPRCHPSLWDGDIPLQRPQLTREPAGIRHAIQQPFGASLQQEAAPHLLALLLVGCVSGCHPEVSLRPSPCCHQRQRLFKQAALQLLRPCAGMVTEQPPTCCSPRGHRIPGRVWGWHPPMWFRNLAAASMGMGGSSDGRQQRWGGGPLESPAPPNLYPSEGSAGEQHPQCPPRTASTPSLPPQCPAVPPNPPQSAAAPPPTLILPLPHRSPGSSPPSLPPPPPNQPSGCPQYPPPSLRPVPVYPSCPPPTLQRSQPLA